VLSFVESAFLIHYYLGERLKPAFYFSAYEY